LQKKDRCEKVKETAGEGVREHGMKGANRLFKSKGGPSSPNNPTQKGGPNRTLWKFFSPKSTEKKVTGDSRSIKPGGRGEGQALSGSKTKKLVKTGKQDWEDREGPEWGEEEQRKGGGENGDVSYSLGGSGKEESVDRTNFDVSCEPQAV